MTILRFFTLREDHLRCFWTGDLPAWQSVGAGDVVTVPCGVWRAIRNHGENSATAFLASGVKLYRFFCELADPIALNTAPPVPTPEVMQKLLSTAARYGLWIGSAAENTAIGLQVG